MKIQETKLVRQSFLFALMTVVLQMMPTNICRADVTYQEDFQHNNDPTVPGFSPSLFVHNIVGVNGFLDAPFFPTPSPQHALFLGATTTDTITFDLFPGGRVDEASVWMTGTGGGWAAVTFVGTLGSLDFQTNADANFQQFSATETDIGEIVAIVLGSPIPAGVGQEAYYDNIQIHVDTTGVLKGDVNGDGVVNLLDVQLFIDYVLNGVYVPAADVNCDGAVDLLDVDPFIDLILP